MNIGNSAASTPPEAREPMPGSVGPALNLPKSARRARRAITIGGVERAGEEPATPSRRLRTDQATLFPPAYDEIESVLRGA